MADPEMKEQLLVWPNFITYYLYFDTWNEPFDNVKVRQALLVPKKQPVQLVTRLQEIADIWNRYKELGDRRLGLAALGAELGIRGDFTSNHINYTNPYAAQVYEERYSGWDGEKIKREVRRVRLRNRLRMPWFEAMRVGRGLLVPARPFLLKLFSK